MPYLRSRGQLQSQASRDSNRGRRVTAKERKASQVREADRLDARRAARIARSRKREAPELLRQPSAQEVEEARRPSVVEEFEIPPILLEEEDEDGWDDELVKADEVKKIWWADEKLKSKRAEERRQGKVSGEGVGSDGPGSGEKRKRNDKEEDLEEGPLQQKKTRQSKLSVDGVSPSTVRKGKGTVRSRDTEEDNEEMSESNDQQRPARTSVPSYLSISGTANTSTGTTVSTVIDAPSQNAIEQQEKDYLHSDSFPLSELQPARDFLEIMAGIAPIFGDSGAGWSRFGPQSPVRPTFLDSLKDEVGADATSSRYILSDSIEAKRYDPDSFLYDPIKAEAAVSGNFADAQRRKFSQIVEPRLRTRHLEVDLLQRKISHGELMSLKKLRLDTRRLASDIAGSSTGLASEYGIGGAGLVLWRLVRVSARVVIPRKGDETHVAWYIILDRSCGGFF